MTGAGSEPPELSVWTAARLCCASGGPISLHTLLVHQMSCYPSSPRERCPCMCGRCPAVGSQAEKRGKHIMSCLFASQSGSPIWGVYDGVDAPPTASMCQSGDVEHHLREASVSEVITI